MQPLYFVVVVIIIAAVVVVVVVVVVVDVVEHLLRTVLRGIQLTTDFHHDLIHDT